MSSSVFDSHTFHTTTQRMIKIVMLHTYPWNVRNVHSESVASYFFLSLLLGCKRCSHSHLKVTERPVCQETKTWPLVTGLELVIYLLYLQMRLITPDFHSSSAWPISALLLFCSMLSGLLTSTSAALESWDHGNYWNKRYLPPWWGFPHPCYHHWPLRASEIVDFRPGFTHGLSWFDVEWSTTSIWSVIFWENKTNCFSHIFMTLFRKGRTVFGAWNTVRVGRDMQKRGLQPVWMSIRFLISSVDHCIMIWHPSETEILWMPNSWFQVFYYK